MIHGSFESYRLGCTGNPIHYDLAKVNLEGFNIPSSDFISEMKQIAAE